MRPEIKESYRYRRILSQVKNGFFVQTKKYGNGKKLESKKIENERILKMEKKTSKCQCK